MSAFRFPRLYRLFIALSVSLWIFAVMPLAAQEDENPCTVDLSAAAVLIVQAQAQASAGNIDAMNALLDQAQAKIDAVQTACAGSSAVTGEFSTPEAVNAPVIHDDWRTFTSSTAGYVVQFPYPWALEEDGSAVFAGSDAVIVGTLANPGAILVRDDQAGAVVVGLPSSLAPGLTDDADATGIAVAYQTAFLNDLSFEVGPVSDATVNGRTAQGFLFLASDYDGALLVFPLDDAGTFGLVLAAVAPNADTSPVDLAHSIAETLYLSN